MNELVLKNKKTLSIIGYMVISNQQIHNYQIRYIKEYLDKSCLLGDYNLIENILSGNKNAIKLEDSILYFNNEAIETRKYLYKELIIIGKLDGNLDKYEKDILEQLHIGNYKTKALVNESIEISNNYILKYQEKDKHKRENFNRLPEEIEMVRDLTERIKNIFIKSNLKLKEIEEIDGKDNYLEVYDEIIKIGKVDYKLVKPIYEELLVQTEQIYNILHKNLKNMQGKLLIEEELRENISQQGNYISKEIIDRLSHFSNELYKKENALEYFTVSFLGRTKVGKTTLHTVLTGEGEENIGGGKQRTTRYNRVYQWNNLRLIDTPGIGAAEADGRTDEEIAKSVIGESDIICIVVSDDSVQEYVFDLAKKIVKRNKPVMILLNYKEDIKNPVRYKLFKRDPYKWKNSRDTNGIYGHIQRINDYAEKEKFEDMITPYPVFLLPALMAMDEKYEEDRIMLIDTSNIDDFQNGINNTILTVGTLLRSQTIIDDSRALFAEARDKLTSSIEGLNQAYGILNTSKKNNMDKLNKNQKELIKDCKNILEESYFQLETQYALRFAEENYSRKNIEELWEEYMEEIKFSKNVSEKLELCFSEFANEVNDIMVEMLDDIKVSMEYSMSINDIDIPFLNMNFKKIGKFLGGIGGIAGTILIVSAAGPIGWVVTGISAAIGLVSGFFKPKAAKRQEAIDKLYGNLKESIGRDKSENIRKILEDIENASSNEIFKIEGLLNDLLEGLNYIIKSGEEALKVYNYNIGQLDLLYGWRIFNYLSDGKIEESQIEEVILDVDREFGKYLNLKVNYNGEFKSRSNNLIREEVSIIKI